MLRDKLPGPLWLGLVLMALMGALAAALVVFGNPGNMGLCGVCFLRDASGAMGLFSGPGPKYFRPELTGVAIGALILVLAMGRFEARAGSHAATRFFFGVWMALGALVFLGCPFRMFQRLGGGDANAWIALPGFILGVGAGLLFEKRGYTAGKTSVASTPGVGLIGPLTLVGLLGWFLYAGLAPQGTSAPPHAPWMISLGLALVAGALLSATGFCGVNAARQVFQRDRRMLLGAGLLVAGYGAVMAVTGRFNWGMDGQPAAHTEWLWNILAMALVGLTGVLAGGCPVRQIVMTGEGNGDAFVTVMGLLLGGALAHTLGIASSSTGTTVAGRWAVVAGLVISLAYALLVVTCGRNRKDNNPGGVAA